MQNTKAMQGGGEGEWYARLIHDNTVNPFLHIYLFKHNGKKKTLGKHCGKK